MTFWHFITRYSYGNTNDFHIKFVCRRKCHAQWSIMRVCLEVNSLSICLEKLLVVVVNLMYVFGWQKAFAQSQDGQWVIITSCCVSVVRKTLAFIVWQSSRRIRLVLYWYREPAVFVVTNFVYENYRKKIISQDIYDLLFWRIILMTYEKNKEVRNLWMSFLTTSLRTKYVSRLDVIV